MKTGRPSKFTDELFQRICERIADGEPLRQICRDEGMPSYRAVYSWIDADNKLLEDEKTRDKALNLSSRFARARDDGHDAIAEECLRIADTPLEGIETEESETGKKIKRGDMLGHRKLQIETRLKLLAKWNPKKYGEKVEVSGPGEKGEHLYVNEAPKLTPEQWLKAHGIGK